MSPSKKDLERELKETKKRLMGTRYIFLVAFAGGIIGLRWGGMVALIIFAVISALGGVCSYIAFMHYISAKKRLE